MTLEQQLADLAKRVEALEKKLEGPLSPYGPSIPVHPINVYPTWTIPAPQWPRPYLGDPIPPRSPMCSGEPTLSIEPGTVQGTCDAFAKLIDGLPDKRL